MKYYRLISDAYAPPEVSFLDASNIRESQFKKLHQGKKLDIKETYWFHIKNSGEFIDNQPSLALHISTVSKKFRDIVVELSNEDEVQFIPILIKNNNHEIIKNDYYLMNVLNYIPEALDKQNSRKPNIDLDFLNVYTHYHFFKDKLVNVNIFTVDEHGIFVSENIKKEIEDNNLIGFDFQKTWLT